MSVKTNPPSISARQRDGYNHSLSSNTTRRALRHFKTTDAHPALPAADRRLTSSFGGPDGVTSASGLGEPDTVHLTSSFGGADAVTSASGLGEPDTVHLTSSFGGPDGVTSASGLGEPDYA